MRPDVSVVIPTYNRAASLRRCLEALQRQSLEACHYEVIVVDDGSTDGTAAVLKDVANRTSMTLRVLNQENGGPARARNRGIVEAEGSFVAFTDDDCIPAPDWLESLRGSMPSDLDCAGIGGKIIRMRDTLVSRFIDDLKLMQPARRGGEVQYLVTANAMYRHACLMEVDGFDERIKVAGGEDPDLSSRLKSCGYHLAATDLAIVRHQHRDTPRGLYRTAWHYGYGLSVGHFFRGSVPEVPGQREAGWRLIRRSLSYWRTRSDLEFLDRVGFGVLSGIYDAGFYEGRVEGARVVQQENLSVGVV